MNNEKFVNDIAYYLPFYLMQPCVYKFSKAVWILTSVGQNFSEISSKDGEVTNTVFTREVYPLLRQWNTLTIEEIKKMDWCHDDCYWVKKKRNGKEILKYDEQQPVTFRPNEYAHLCNIGIDLFDLIKNKLAYDIRLYNTQC